MKLARRIFAYVTLGASVVVGYGLFQEGEPDYDMLAYCLLVALASGIVLSILELVSGE